MQKNSKPAKISLGLVKGKQVISGLFENCIGTDDREAAIRYWTELGYRVVQEGNLSAGQAGTLYAHHSALTSLRLQNGASNDHGQVRLMLWEQPRNNGLEYAKPLDVGSRWFASMVKDVYSVYDAFQDDDKAGERHWVFSEPARAIINVGNEATGLYDRFRGVREMFVIGQQTRQAFFQRYGYTRPGYGTITDESPMGVSEGTHSSMVTADHSTANFYAEVLGLIPVNPGHKSGYQKPATKTTLMLEDGQEFLLTAFQSPVTIVGLFQIYSPLYPSPDLRDQAQPGSLGLALFIYRVDNLNEYHERIKASAATAVTAIIRNEFGESSFGFVAPDGMYWNLLAQ